MPSAKRTPLLAAPPGRRRTCPFLASESSPPPLPAAAVPILITFLFQFHHRRRIRARPSSTPRHGDRNGGPALAAIFLPLSPGQIKTHRRDDGGGDANRLPEKHGEMAVRACQTIATTTSRPLISSLFLERVPAAAFLRPRPPLICIAFASVQLPVRAVAVRGISLVLFYS